MLDLPVTTSMLGERWHREHLASSGDENMLYFLSIPDDDELLLDEMESSLVT